MQPRAMVRRSFLALCAFLFGMLIMDASLRMANVGSSILESGVWSKWDSGHYEDIAAEGYHLELCGNPPRLACGNVSWFPGYPLLGRAFGSLTGIGADERWRGSLRWISWASYGVALYLLAWLLELHDPGPNRLTRFLLLLTGSVFPGAIYYPAVFPISLLLALVLGALVLVTKAEAEQGAARARYLRWIFALEFCAAVTYSVGWLLAVSIAASEVLSHRKIPRTVYLHLVAGACGVLAVLTLQWIETGHFFAFFYGQGNYPHGHDIPFMRLGREVLSVLMDGGGSEMAQHTLFVMVLCILGTLSLARLMRSSGKKIQPITAALIFCWLIFLIPFASGNTEQSTVRPQGLLLPILISFPSFRRSNLLAAAALMVSLHFAVIFARQFFRGVLI